MLEREKEQIRSCLGSQGNFGIVPLGTLAEDRVVVRSMGSGTDSPGAKAQPSWLCHLGEIHSPLSISFFSDKMETPQALLVGAGRIK